MVAEIIPSCFTIFFKFLKVLSRSFNGKCSSVAVEIQASNIVPLSAIFSTECGAKYFILKILFISSVEFIDDFFSTCRIFDML